MLYKRMYRPSFRRYSVAILHPHTHKSLPKDFDATKFRRWADISPIKDSSKAFSVMSYNLLSQHYLWEPVFNYLDQDYLDWQGYRLPLINATLKQLNCDIMFFQEMESQVYKQHWRYIFPDYDTLYKRKPAPKYWGSQPVEYLDGVGIFVNREKFSIVKSKCIHFGQYIEEHPEIFKLTKDMQERVIPRNTVAILAKLKDKRTGTYLYVTNTHLYWNPIFNDVKVLQTKTLLIALSEFIDEENLNDLNIVMGGDYNSTPESDVFHLLEGDSVNPETSETFQGTNYQVAKITNQFELETAYKSLLSNPDNKNTEHCLKFTSFTKALTAILDHIWYSKKTINVNRILGEVNNDYYNNSKGFPNNQFPSDHIPLVAELEFK